MPEIKINDRISYIPSCEKPLSSEVGIVRGDRFTYIYDTGSIPETLEFLQSLNGQCDIVISHFHGDHTWWLTGHKRGDEGVEENDNISLIYERPKFRRLYIGSLTKKYIPDGDVISVPTMISSSSGLRFSTEERIITGKEVSAEGKITPDAETARANPVEKYDGVKIDIYPIPNSHCKGALLMMVDDEYAFIGDSSYCMEKDGRPMYNSQLLKAEIDLLESIPADKLLVSHDRKFVRNKAVVLRQLKTIYSHRTTDSPYICVK